jgi:hypothetical protein
MEAIIHLTTIAALPCTISHETPFKVNFHITRDIATATTMNTLSKMEGVSMFIYSDHVSVRVPRCFVESLVYVD